MLQQQLRRYHEHWLRWHARVTDHLSAQQHPAWWC